MNACNFGIGFYADISLFVHRDVFLIVIALGHLDLCGIPLRSSAALSAPP